MEEDQCGIYFNMMQSKLEIFLQTLNQFLKIKIEDVKSYEHSKRVEFNLETIIKDINNKFQTLSTCEFHTNYDLSKLKSTFERLLTTFQNKKKENDIKFNNIHDTVGFEEVDRLENNISAQDQIIYREYNNKIEINEEYINIKGKIAGMNKLINEELIKGEKYILEIDNNVEESDTNLIKTNEELRQAALLRNKSNSIKYPLVLGTIFGAVGTVVPVVGNVIGASLGAAIGYGVSKIEKNAIKKIEPEKYK
jgi:hypothetical protein